MLDGRSSVAPALRLGLALLVCGPLCLFGPRLCAQSPPRSGPSAGGSSAVAPYRGPQFEPIGPQILVAGVRVVGNETVPNTKIQSLIRTRRDRAFDPEVVQSDVRALVASGMFRDVRTYTEPTAEGMLVTFQLFERPTIHEIQFVGNRGITDKALKKQAGLKVGDALNFYTVEEARRKIEDFYQSKGYAKTRVNILEGDKPQDRRVVLQIDEGQIHRIFDVDFVGNTIASDARLKTQIQSKPGFLWYLFGGKVDRAKIDEDIDRLTNYYRSLGFFAARIGRELRYSESGHWLNVTFVIDEGPRYVVRSASVLGNEKFDTDALTNMLELKSGLFFNSDKMNRDLNILRDLYGSQGHIFADIKADPRFLEEPGQLDLVYTIQEGEQYRVGRINVHIEGEYPHTRQNVVLNRISLQPGDIVDIRKIRDSERRLKASQLFVNEPARGVTPRIEVRPPELRDFAGSMAGGAGSPRRSSHYRGQSPDEDEPTPGVRYTDVEVFLPPDFEY
jgi:outer membrane protein insertion porin family